MQTSITSMSAEASSTSSLKNKPGTVEPTGPSFNQFLSKEIGVQKNASANIPSNNQGNKQISNQANKVGSRAENKDENKTGNKISPIPVQTSVKKSETPANIQTKKDDSSESDATSLANEQANNAQIIAFVENLGQFPLKAPPAPTTSDSENSALIDSGLNAPSSTALLAAASANTTKLEASKSANLSTSADQALTSPATFDEILATTSLQIPTKGKTDVAVTKINTANLSDIVPEKKMGLLANQDTNHDAGIEMKVASDIISTAVEPVTEKKIQTTESNKNLVAELVSDKPSVQIFAQQLAVTASHMEAPGTANHLTPHVGTSAWDQAVGQKVVWMVAGGQQTAELTLNPPDLGPVQVVISVNNDQANASFFSAQPDVREALESAMPKLRQMMSDAGVQLSGFSVGTQTSNQGNPAQQFSGDRPASQSQNNTRGTGNDSLSSTTIVTTSKMTMKDGLVDTFA
ncbi:flagellar hook-length control protein FliK [soil metagenome]